ncbi:hypothetical protein ACP275_08G100500 [Erythranthe tilingii]
MEVLYVSLISLIVSSFVFIFLQIGLLYKKKLGSTAALPPGKTGWPMIGESLEFLSAGWKGQPEKFMFDRMSKYSSKAFLTNILGEKIVVFCGASGNKFLFSNEDKLVRLWFPTTFHKIFASSSLSSSSEESLKLRKMTPQFLKGEALKRYVGIMDHTANKHFEDGWEKKKQVVVSPLIKDYTFSVGCKIFLSIHDPQRVDKLAQHFNTLIDGLFSIPCDFPGSTFSKGIKASKLLIRDLVSIVEQRKIDLAEGKASLPQDILSHMLLVTSSTSDEISTATRNLTAEMEIAEKVLALLIASRDTASCVCAFIVMYLAELPHIYDRVYIEQMEIAKSKPRGELLNWDDLDMMKYSWNVASEALRLATPVQGGFKEAITDFEYNGFSIPKGYKLYWKSNTTHRNPEFFPDPMKFDPSRFKGSVPAPYTYVPFGGGPRMCPGTEFARLEILVFMHNLVKRFRCEKIIPDEKLVVDPIPKPVKGLPIRLFPHDDKQY